MLAKTQLIFDTTDAETLAASDKVGAVLTTADGTLLTATGTALDVNVASGTFNVNSDGVHSGGNTDPDNMGQILHVRNATPGDAHQTFRSTGANPNASALDPATIFAADANAFTHAWNGTGWDRVTSTSGAVNTHIAGQAGTLSVNDTANTAVLQTQKNVATTGALLASQLAGRRYLFVQNLGTKHIYVGASGVTKTNGLRLSPNTTAEFRLGAAVSLHAVSEDNNNQDTRVLELS